MGKLRGKFFLGILFVFLCIGTEGHARETTYEQEVTQKAFVVVSILDGVAFTQADTDSLRRYVQKILPEHEFVHIVEHVNITFGSIISPAVTDRVRESIAQQIKLKILPHHEISHLVIMDHGKTDFYAKDNAATYFKFLSFFDKNEVSPVFKKIFDPLVGKFSENAFVMLESCLTVCDALNSSQERIKTLMDYFKISGGTLFGAYQSMVSVGYEYQFHLEQAANRMKNPLFIAISLTLGLASQLSSPSFNFSEFLMVTAGFHVVIPSVLKGMVYLRQKSQDVNWGFLYKFENSRITKIFELNPYNSKNELYLKLEPHKFKTEFNSCNSLFH